MAAHNNPAGRLHELLVRCAAAPNPGNDLSIKEAWRTALDVEDGDDASLLSRLGLVYALPGQIRMQVNELRDDSPDLLLRHFTRFEEALQMPLNGNWSQNFYTHVQGEPMYSLELCADRLGRASTETAIDPATLDDLRTHIEDLLVEILSAKIDEGLKLLLARHAQSMRSAVEEVQIRGADALRDVAEAAIGGVVIFGQVNGEPKNAKEKSVWTKLIAAAAGILVLVNAGKASLELGEAVYEALPIGASEAREPAIGESDEVVVEAELIEDEEP